MVRRTSLLALAGLAWFSTPCSAAQSADAARVIREACGDNPKSGCVAELHKVCHSKVTMRCYLSRKHRFDVKRGTAIDSPERQDERDDRSIFYDE